MTFFLFYAITNLPIKDEDFFPFLIPFSDTIYSPVSLKNLNHFPAGKYGFIKIKKNGHLCFEKDTTEIKFFGAQIFYNDPDSDNAKIIAGKFLKLGFNVWKWGAFELFWNKGINKQGWEIKIRRFDYLFYQMKMHGIYCYAQIDEYGIILPSLYFNEAKEYYKINDIDSFTGEKEIYSKGIQYIMEKSIFDAQKKYWYDFFNHFNPYTKLKYKDDPAIIIVELTNENFLIKQWEYFGLEIDRWPENYRKRFNQLWNNWLKKKYKTLEEIKTAWEENSKISVLNEEKYGEIKFYPLKMRDTTFSIRRRADMANFLFYLQNTYFERCEKYLRKIGVKALIIRGNDFQMNDFDKLTSSKSKFIDSHIYYAHPDIIGKKGRIKNTNPFKRRINIVSPVSYNSVLDCAVSVSEANWSYPSEHQYLFIPLFMSYAAFQDWDIVILHAFCSNSTYKLDYIEQQLIFALNPLIITHCYLGSLIFRNRLISTDTLFYYNMNSNSFIDYINNRKIWEDEFEHLLPLKYKIRTIFKNEKRKNLKNLPKEHLEDSLVNTTGELKFNKKRELFIIDNKFVKSINGYLEGLIELMDFKILNIKENKYGSISIISLDKNEIKNSNKMLFILCSSVRNSNCEWDVPGESFKEWGKGPPLASTIECKIRLNTYKRNFSFWSLGVDGNKKKLLKSIFCDSGYIEIEFEKKDSTIWYLLEAN
uniref:Glycoside hydrolase family 42 N-terminal domain-containing protein n=1 Tax=candidate division WOR-3 bacterium TaxID=2052148 RepID=A0A7C4UFR0_UNCW3